MNAKKRILISLSLILVVLALSGCNLFLKPNGDLTGTVVDANSTPLAAAKIFADGKLIGTSDDQGKIVISLKPGKYEVYADFHGKTSAKQTVDVATDGGKVDLKVDIAPSFEDDFAGAVLDATKWKEEAAWELNQWAITAPGIKVENSVVKRNAWVLNTSSGIYTVDQDFEDAVVVIKIRDTKEREEGNAGLRIHLRNDEEYWADGYGINLSAFGWELANWFEKTKGTFVLPSPNQPQLTDTEWVIVTAVFTGHEVAYYRNGVLIAELSETSVEKQHTSGGLFLEFNGDLEIDYVRVYSL